MGQILTGFDISGEQISRIVREQESDAVMADVCRCHRISEAATPNETGAYAPAVHARHKMKMPVFVIMLAFLFISVLLRCQTG